MAGIYDFDADGDVVQAGTAAPIRDAGVPRAALLRNKTIGGAVLVHDIVAGYSCRWVAQAVDGVLGGLHAGVVQDQHVDAVMAGVMIGTRFIEDWLHSLLPPRSA